MEPSRLWGLWRAIEQARPALVVTFLHSANTYGRLVSIVAGVPHRIACERCERPPGKRGSLRYWTERLLAPLTDAVVFNSRHSEARFGDWGIRVRTCTIPNGVELPRVDPGAGWALLRTLGVPESATLVGNVAQLDRRKDQDLFLRMAACLARGPHLHFVLVGDGPERAQLENASRQLGLTSRVTFTGRLDDPLPVMACLRVKVLTSLLEGMPNSVMEAMALGIPCVVSAAGGSAELVTDGIQGFVVRERDPRVLAERVERLLDDSELWRSMSEASRRRIASEFSVKRMVLAYERLFAEVTGASPRFPWRGC